MSKKVVIIGGGHGQATICRGIKNLKGIEITAIVTVADDGGSTGRIRQRFQIPAMGDIRNVIVALAERETAMSSLMEYRFEDKEGKGEDIAGHNLGNLILTALTYQTGSFLKAIKTLEEILKVRGKVVPSTTEIITLFAQRENQEIVKGEANIPHKKKKIFKVFYEQEVKANENAVLAILEADLIIYGIGSVYTSILPNLIIKEISEALKKTKARKFYFCNAMTQADETKGYSLENHTEALILHGAVIDGVIFSKDFIPPSILERYKKVGSEPVLIREEFHNYQIIKANLLSFEKNLIRHDPKKIEKVIEQIILG